MSEREEKELFQAVSRETQAIFELTKDLLDVLDRSVLPVEVKEEVTTVMIDAYFDINKRLEKKTDEEF